MSGVAQQNLRSIRIQYVKLYKTMNIFSLYDPETFWIDLKKAIADCKLKSVNIIFHSIEYKFLKNMHRDFNVEGML